MSGTLIVQYGYRIHVGENGLMIHDVTDDSLLFKDEKVKSVDCEGIDQLIDTDLGSLPWWDIAAYYYSEELRELEESIARFEKTVRENPRFTVTFGPYTIRMSLGYEPSGNMLTWDTNMAPATIFNNADLIIAVEGIDNFPFDLTVLDGTAINAFSEDILNHRMTFETDGNLSEMLITILASLPSNVKQEWRRVVAAINKLHSRVISLRNMKIGNALLEMEQFRSLADKYDVSVSHFMQHREVITEHLAHHLQTLVIESTGVEL